MPTELGCATTGLLKEKFPKIVNTKFTAQMETNLDKVGCGEADYVKMLDEFYGDFEKTLDKAKAEMKNVKIQLEEDTTDIPCEKCGRMMVIKTGRYGRFLACPGYPECKNAKPLILNTGVSGRISERLHLVKLGLYASLGKLPRRLNAGKAPADDLDLIHCSFSSPPISRSRSPPSCTPACRPSS